MKPKKIVSSGVIVIAIVVGLIYYFASQNNSVSKKGPEAAMLESVGLAEFSPDNDVVSTVTGKDKKLYEDILAATKISGDGKDPVKNQQAIDAISKIIDGHSDYADLYSLRAVLEMALPNPNTQNVIADIDKAIKLRPSATDTKYTSMSSSIAPMYALRAKADVVSKDYKQALTDLETAVKVDLTKPNDVFNTGGVKPGENTNPTALEKNDFDILVSAYPDDYRTYLFRGLFYNSFSFYDKQYYQPAATDLKKAIDLNPNSALADYFMGTAIQKAAFFIYQFKISGGTAGYDSARDTLNTKASDYLRQAIKIDPSFKEAYAQLAESLYSLKKYSEAIPYYDKVIEIDPNDSGAYNDRGLAKTYTGDYYTATSDFSDAIRLKKDDQNSLENTYENRADAYIKASNYDSAIEDFSSAIGLKFASQVFLMSLQQIRTIYPELNSISDKDLLEGLRQKYFPNMSPADFTGQYQKNTKPYEDFVLAGLYVGRGNAYLHKGNFKKAAGEYSRALHDDSTYVYDRWESISKTAENEYLIDTQTLDFSQAGNVSLWVQISNTNDNSYFRTNFQINCTDRKIKSASSTRYDSTGNVTGTIPEQDWQSVVPETIGEALYNGMCTDK